MQKIAGVKQRGLNSVGAIPSLDVRNTGWPGRTEAPRAFYVALVSPAKMPGARLDPATLRRPLGTPVPDESPVAHDEGMVAVLVRGHLTTENGIRFGTPSTEYVNLSAHP